MIPAAVDWAIVEIRDGTQVLGTGFLVSTDGLVLTARHVTHPRTRITAAFIDGTTSGAEVVDFGQAPADDWALCRLTNVPAAIAPIPLADLRSVMKEVVWYTVGFPNLRANLRGGLHGVVRREVPKLELYCRELTDKSYDDARGISGAPCIVDGEAVGLIVDVLRQNAGPIVTGEVQAIPIAAIQPRNLALSYGRGSDLPWQRVFSYPLQAVTEAERQMAADIVRLSPQIPPAPDQIARRMINQGVDATAKVMKQIDRIGKEVVDEIMSLADTLWVRGSAAESFAQITDVKGVGWIATERDWCAVHHLYRAYACRQQTKFAWRYVVVRSAYVEPVADTIALRTREALCRELETTEAHVRRKLAKQACVAAFIVGTPRDDVVQKLRAEFPTLVIVFMSRAQNASAAGAVAQPIIPAPSPDEETQADESNDDARDYL
jgi:hypothetical protein